MANYTEKDLSDILVEYITDRCRQAEELEARANATDNPLDLAMTVGKFATMVSRTSRAASIIIDLAADENSVKQASQTIDIIRQLYKDLGWGGLRTIMSYERGVKIEIEMF